MAPKKLAPDAKVELVQERYPSGAVKIAREVTQDEEGNIINHGAWKMYDERGRLKMEGTYELHQPHGEWMQMYYEAVPKFMQQPPYRQFSPPIKSRVTFEKGQLHGDWLVTDSKQLKVSEVRFVEGQREGKAVWYSPNGKPRREALYRQGFIDGELVDFGPNGEAGNREKYEEGRRLAPKTTFHQGEQKKTSGMYLFARLVVQQPDDWWQGVMATYTTEGKDEKHGAWTSWHTNGVVEQKGEFDHDVPTGKTDWWFSNGQHALTGEYIAGKPHGDWTWWHDNGIQATVGHYDAGVPVEKWTWWKNDGRVAQKIDYATGTGEIVNTDPIDRKPSSPVPTIAPAPKTGKTDVKETVPSVQRPIRKAASR